MSILEDYQGLLGSLVTLCAAAIGFAGVIYSQRSLVRMTREQSDVAIRLKLRSFQNAMVGELTALQQSIGRQAELLQAQIGLAEGLAKAGLDRKTQPRVSFMFATPIFDSHVGQIGLLSPVLSFKISSLYGTLKSYSAQAQVDVPEMNANHAVQVMHSVKEGLNALLLQADEVKVALEKTIGEFDS